MIPLALGAVGLVLSIIGGFQRKGGGVEDSHVFAALILNVFSILGALLLMSLWRHWMIFVVA